MTQNGFELREICLPLASLVLGLEASTTMTGLIALF